MCAVGVMAATAFNLLPAIIESAKRIECGAKYPAILPADAVRMAKRGPAVEPNFWAWDGALKQGKAIASWQLARLAQCAGHEFHS